MAGTPNEDEAAAITAAIERFRAETAAAPGAEEDAVGPWHRVALLDGVSAKGTFEKSEGGEGWLS
jgi:hypothetical protein